MQTCAHTNFAPLSINCVANLTYLMTRHLEKIPLNTILLDTTPTQGAEFKSIYQATLSKEPNDKIILGLKNQHICSRVQNHF